MEAMDLMAYFLRGYEHDRSRLNKERSDVRPITPNDLLPNDEIFAILWQRVEEFMSKPPFDPSHNFNHIYRVVVLAGKLMNAENTRRREHKILPLLQPTLVYYAALLHDVADYKYLKLVPEGNRPVFMDSIDNLVEYVKKLDGEPPSKSLLQAVLDVVEKVGYSKETANPDAMQAALQAHPELGVVQDADRLEAIGAMGLGRLFCYTGARNFEGEDHVAGRSLDDTVKHLDEKLLKLPGLMKTDTGRKLAAARAQRLEEFKKWWEDEYTLGQFF
jgi:uncharacterized protein